MAARLAKVYGTEMDKVNCPFFYKMGACRYGDSCERIHNKPPISETVCLKHMYQNNAVETALIDGHNVSRQDAEAAMAKYENFYQETFKEMMKYGEIEDMIVVDNLGDHIVGNVYVKYSDEDFAENAQKHTNGRFFNSKKIEAEYSPVTDFLNAKCKQYIDGSCKRGGYCNYMHIKPLSMSFKKDLFAQMYVEHPEYREKRTRADSDSEDWRDVQRRYERKEEEGGEDRSRSRERKKHRKEKDRSRSKERKDKDRSRSKERKHKDKKKKQKKQKRKHSHSQSPAKEVEKGASKE